MLQFASTGNPERELLNKLNAPGRKFTTIISFSLSLSHFNCLLLAILDQASYEDIQDVLREEGSFLKDIQSTDNPTTSDDTDQYYISSSFETFSRHDGHVTPAHSQAPISQYASSTIADRVNPENLGDSTIYTQKASTVYSDETEQDLAGYNLAPKQEESYLNPSETLEQTGRHRLLKPYITSIFSTSYRSGNLSTKRWRRHVQHSRH